MDARPPSYAEGGSAASFSSAPPYLHQAQQQSQPLKYPNAAAAAAEAGPMSGAGGPPLPMVNIVQPQATTGNETTNPATASAPVSNLMQYGAKPVHVVCASCHQFVSTQPRFQTGSFTYLCSFGLALVGCCLCACVPCCVDSCKDVYHYCPNCDAQLGLFKRL